MVPKVSVLVSLYKAEPFISAFLQRASWQTYQQAEYLFILNEPFEPFVLEQIENSGLIKKVSIVPLESLYTSWNRGISMARGEYITNMNVDDKHHIASLALAAFVLDKNPDIGLIRGNTVCSADPHTAFDSNECDLEKVHFFEKTDRHCGPHPMWRKECHSKCGLFDDSYKAAADHDMWIRFYKSGEKFLQLDFLTCIYLEHLQTLSNRSGSSAEINQILQKHNVSE